MNKEPISAAIREHQRAKKAQIYNSFKQAVDPSKLAQPISKAEFEEQFPVEKFELYTLTAVDQFRQEILKAEDVTDKDGAFQKATEDLKPFIVHGEGKRVIMFTREKQKGE